MQGILLSYVTGRKHQDMNHLIMEVKEVDSKAKAAGLLGKSVVWLSPAKKAITGRVSNPHGSRGKVKVIFPRGLPGQALGTKVEVKE